MYEVNFTIKKKFLILIIIKGEVYYEENRAYIAFLARFNW